MKEIILVAAILLGILILLQSFTIMSTQKTEEQPYKLILKEKDFEIRHYPEAVIATIQSTAKSYKELSGPGFRKLAAYIFGGNESSKKIAMTTPVHMDINDAASSMSFVMPTVYNETNLPKPNDPNVVIKRTKDEYVAAIRFDGYASDKDIKLYAAKLKQLLQEKGIITHGNYRFLGYNPPYQFIGRRNEVIVTVNWNG